MDQRLIKLVAYGNLDIYLNGVTSVTNFKVNYRRHTNFSLECPYTNVYNRKNDRNYNNFNIIIGNSDDKMLVEHNKHQHDIIKYLLQQLYKYHYLYY